MSDETSGSGSTSKRGGSLRGILNYRRNSSASDSGQPQVTVTIEEPPRSKGKLDISKQREEIFQIEREIVDVEQELGNLGPEELTSPVFRIPLDEVEIKKEKREIRTLENALPKEAFDLKGQIEPSFLSDFLNFYKKDWTRVRCKYDDPNLPESAELVPTPNLKKLDIEMPNDESDEAVPSPTEVGPDHIDASLFQEYHGIISDKKNKSVRIQYRNNLFHLVPPDPVSSKPPKKLVPLTESVGRQVLVEVKKLTMAIGDIEPLFGTLAVYDIVKRRRVTENFHFDLNNDELSKLMEEHQRNKDKVNIGKKCLFTISEPTTDLFLVLRVEKVLQGDLEAALDNYVKNTQLKDKEKEKLRQVVAGYCSRLGAYRQPFCWGMIPLFSEDLSGLAGGENSEFKPLYRQKPTEISDSHMLELVNEYSKSNSSKRNKTIPGTFVVDLVELTNPAPGTLTPSLVPVTSPADEVIREVQEFKPASAVPAPYLSYVNNLYIYPESVNLNNRGGSVGARNLSVKVQLLDSDENLTPEGLKVFYGRSSGPAFTNHAYTAVTYHSKTPQFYDEIKLKLPLQLTQKHHLLFTFYHVTCQEKQKGGIRESVETPVGFSILPLYQDMRIIDKDHTIPVSIELLPNYLLPEVESQMKFVDNKKPLFKLRLELVSTVYTTDKYLNNFFISSRRGDSRFLKHLQNLVKAKPHVVIKFLPVLFSTLFRVMCTFPDYGAEAFVVLNQLVESVYNGYNSISEPTALLNAYAEYVFENPAGVTVPVYEELCKQWLAVLKKNKDNDQCVKFSWFLFKIVFKSMALHFQSNGKLAIELRDGRFSNFFIENLKELSGALATEIQHRSKTSITIAKDASKSLASFIRTLLAIAPRTVVLRLIDRVVKEITFNQDGETLVELKFDFIGIVYDYPYFVPLSLPFPHQSVEPSDDVWSYCKNHFLIGLLLHQVAFYITIHKDKAIRGKALLTLKNLLRQNDLDARFQDPSSKEKIAGMYFPFVWTVIDNIETFKEYDFEEKRNIYTCFLFVIKNINLTLLGNFIKNETQPRVRSFFAALCQCVEIFEFVGEEKWTAKMQDSRNSKTREAKTLLENYYAASFGGDNSGGSGASTKGGTTGSTGTGKFKSLREKRAAIAQRKQSDGDSLKGSTGGTGRFARALSVGTRQEKGENQFDFVGEVNLSNEISFLILDLIEYLIQEFESELNVQHWSQHSLLDNIFNLWLALFKRSQTQWFISSLYATSRKIVTKFSKQLFTLSPSTITELCLDVVRHCNYSSDSTRREASAFLYLLMRKNFEEDMKSFTKVKVQTTIALSKLVGDGIKTDAYLRKSMETISKYVTSRGGQLEQNFAHQVDELSKRLNIILRDSIKINQHSADPEMMADLYYRIAKGYTNAPDLRVAWLESLSNFHMKHKNWAEAAQCYLHLSALVAEYLHQLEGKNLPSSLPHSQGCSAFQTVAKNVMEESAIAEISVTEENVYDSKSQLFTENGLVELMNKGLEYLKQAELYETANDLYKLIIPVYEKSRDYSNLAKLYGDLREIYLKIIQANETHSRLLGSYYRVGFYGKMFEELDGAEFIYKEPKITRLGEIKDRLIQIFATRFKGEDKVQVITDSNVVDRSKLSDGIAYIQITSVQPYFDSEEIKQRVTYYDRNNNIHRFMFSTPFTMGVRSQSDSVKEQYKRKTILTVENVFPYVKKRMLVTKKEELILTPIENSIELIESRVDAINSELRAPVVKTLQSILQGSLLVAVNSGPKEICITFFAKGANDYPKHHVERLRTAFREFAISSENALRVNKTLIGREQLAFHNELENGYKELKALIDEYVENQKP